MELIVWMQFIILLKVDFMSSCIRTTTINDNSKRFHGEDLGSDPEHLVVGQNELDQPRRLSVAIQIFTSGKSMNNESFPHFWRSTGLCPPEPYQNASEFLLSPDERLNIALIGSLPHQSVTQVRVHWMLDLVSARIDHTEVIFDFKQLDSFLKVLLVYDLNPGFELMGNPSNIFNDFENSTQLIWWEKLIREIAERCIDRFGISKVRTWNFETWNEPDHHDFNHLNFTTKGFINYLKATYKGFKSASPSLRFGGPGGSCREPNFSKLCWLVLGIVNDRNNDLNFDFISFHSKGNEDVDSMINSEVSKIARIHEKFPNLKTVSVFNDEADFMKGWWKPREWKADHRYAVLVCRSVIRHAAIVVNKNLNYELLSFDNAFMNEPPSYFNQRTLFARFPRKYPGNRSQFIKKSSYTILGLLSLHGTQRTVVNSSSFIDPRIQVLATHRKYISLPNSSVFSYQNRENQRLQGESCNQNHLCATRLKQPIKTSFHRNFTRKKFKKTSNPQILKVHQDIREITVMVSFSNATKTSNERKILEIHLEDLPHSFIKETLYLVEYSIKSSIKGPYDAWKDLNTPKYPTTDQIQYMRSFETIRRTRKEKLYLERNQYHHTFELSLPSVAVLHICQLNFVPLPQVTRLRCESLDRWDLLITWADQLIETRCILQYQVYFSRDWPLNPLRLLQTGIYLQNNYIRSVQSNNGTLRGWYSVRAELYNDVAGPLSKPILCPPN